MATKKTEEEERLEHLDDVIERTYSHPDLSPWHVREALRLLRDEIRILSQRREDT